MKTEDDTPIAREPWQRLLRDRYEAPPEVTDARIRAAARRALAPRPARWWLPASLAASVLLAVMLVQWQLGDDSAPAYVTESDVAGPMSVAPQAADAAADAVVSDEAAAESAGSARQMREAPAARPEVAPPSTPPPLLDLPAYRGPPEPAREREAPARAEESRNLGKLQGFTQSAAVPRDPQEWYAEIEALRAAGRIEEADAELARLEAAWPGWLEKNHPQNR
jgi:hypothetical protein